MQRIKIEGTYGETEEETNYNKKFEAPCVRLCDSKQSALETMDLYELTYDVSAEDMEESVEKPFVIPESTEQYSLKPKVEALGNFKTPRCESK